MPIKDPVKLKEARQRADAKRKGTRYLSWTAVVYPDSAPENWRDIIDDTHIEWVESPLHDKDINPDGSIKKPHWHILLMFPSVQTERQVKELLKPINCTIPINCKSARGLVRYMAHIDNPEKAQYSISEIRGHGGADVAKLLQLTASERHEIIKEMVVWVDENKIIHFVDLMNYALRERSDWFITLCDSSAFVMKEYIKSNWQKLTYALEKGVEKEK